MATVEDDQCLQRQIQVLAQQHMEHILLIEEDIAREDDVERTGRWLRFWHCTGKSPSLGITSNSTPNHTVNHRIEQHTQHHYRRVELVGIRVGITAAQLVAHLHSRGYAHIITCRLSRNLSSDRGNAPPMAILELIPLPGLMADAINEAMTIQRDAQSGRKAREPQIPVDPSIGPRGTLGVRWKELRSHHNYVDRYAIGEGGLPVLGAKAFMQSALFQVGVLRVNGECSAF